MTRTTPRWPRTAIAALAFALACGSSHPAALRTATPSPSARDFPPFPAGETPPSAAEIAAMLASGLPEPDRAAATRPLIDDILSRDLRDLPGDPAAQPNARAIAHAVYDTLATLLGQLARDRRLPRLATIACTRRGDRVIRRATSLAVARYVAERGRPRSTLVVGYLDEARPYLAMTAEELQAEADRIEHDLTAYERDTRSSAACYEQQRVLLVQGRHALDAVRSGRFDPATGALYVFLRNAGEKPQHLDPP